MHWFPHPACRKPHALWSAPDKQATEDEVTNFVGALARLLKPDVIAETGTYAGFTTRVLADAVEVNGVGHVTSFEIEPLRADAARAALQSHIGAHRVTVITGAITRDTCPTGIELAFLDSGMRTRQADMSIVWPRVVGGGIVLVHDASPLRPPGLVRPPSAFAMFDIATPRGLLIFQKNWM